MEQINGEYLSNFDDDIEKAFEIMKDEKIKNNNNSKKKCNTYKKNYNIINKDQYTFTNCKKCNKLFKISCKYDGEFPLCYEHRDPNNRI